MNNKYEIYIDNECLMCTSFGEKAKTKSKNVSLRSNTELSKELLELDSIILVTNYNTYSGFDAISKIISNWGFFYKIINLIKFLPRFISTKLYKLIANHRHQISRLIN
ncbi:MAG: DCC1-like thiol-disulfide oxidoreductase family protein [Actinomycetota bacterium]|nr:DCC1-like thiol-disulfide oxidoreductase family protein [Actinomycetota bacterium]